MSHETPPEIRDIDLAIVGLSCRVPGANTPEAFWDNVLGGVESIVDVDDETLRRRGVEDAERAHPHYVPRTACMDDVEGFDAGFFGWSAVDARIADPQHRHLLECAWEALESAGHAPETFTGRIGVFAGSGMHAYFTYHLAPNSALMDEHGLFLIRHTANDKDFLATRVSYAMNLRGPSVNVQTACSTSLVAVHMGCQSLLNMESDLVLCGGVTIELPHGVGYRYQPGEILSADGRCRALDAQADGTVFGSGVGVVAIRRLQDALEDGDPIRAVIRATAINNDGNAKVGYLAPSVDGQAAVIAEAIELAEVTPDTIGYVELHGTGTPVGDPIELAALRQAFGAPASGQATCYIGSVKPNIGHLDTAAGIASLIKAVGMLERKQLAPSLHVTAPNPALELEGSAFAVATNRMPWPSRGPRRVGVNSIGVGGTNAHVILQEAPPRPTPAARESTAWLPISARDPQALAEGCARLSAWCHANPDARLDDLAFTLQEGRAAHPLRTGVVVRSIREAAARFAALAPPAEAALDAPRTVWAFAGGGAQFPGMAADAYAQEPVFREAFDAALAALNGPDRDQIHRLATTPRDALLDEDGAALERPSLALPALLATQVATARWLLAHGAAPDILIGHSMGEYTAAHLAGVFGLRDVMRLVRTRGELFERLPPGAMLSVALSASELAKRLPAALDVAADNATELSLASGPIAAIEALESALSAEGIATRRVPIAVAAHSSMLEPILAPFRAFLQTIPMHAPTQALISNLSGVPATADEVQSPEYWVRHLRETVRFGDGIAAVLADGSTVVTEVGPGRTLTSLTEMNASYGSPTRLVTTLGPRRTDEDRGHLLRQSIAALWSAGAAIDPHVLRGPAPLQRLVLPTYAFQHQRFWIDRIDPATSPVARGAGAPGVATHTPSWWVPSWTPWSPADPAGAEARKVRSGTAVVLHDRTPLADAVVAALSETGAVVTVHVGPEIARDARLSWRCPLHTPARTGEVLDRIRSAHGEIHTVIDFWTQACAELFESVVARARALSKASAPVDWALVTERGAALPGDRSVHAEVAPLHGAVPVLDTELDAVRVVAIDVDRRTGEGAGATAEQLVAAARGATAHLIGVRQGIAFDRQLVPHTLPAPSRAWSAAPGDVVIFTGGLGGMAAALALALTERTDGLTVALWGRTPMPPRAQWPALRGALAVRAERIEAIEAAGAKVLLDAVDVADAPAVLAAFERAQAHGPVRGVVHAAGVLDDGLLDTRTADRIAAVFRPKIMGALALQAATQRLGSALDWVVLCSSHSSFAGLAGQADYAGANAFLDAIVGEPFGPGGPRVHAIDWPAWADTGMAADALAELRAERGTLANHPWLGRQTDASPQRSRFRRMWSATEDWPLDQHRLRGELAVLPGTMFVCLALAATEAHAGHPTTLVDVAFVEAFAVLNDRPRALDVLVDSESGTWRATSTSPAGEPVLHAQGGFRAADASRATPRWKRRRPDPEWTQELKGPRRDPFVVFGPRWGVATRVSGSGREATVHLGAIASSAASSEPADDHLDAALLDVATGSAQRLAGIDPDAVFLIPVGYDAVEHYGPVVQDAIAWIRCTRPLDASETALFDVSVVNPSGDVALRVVGYTMRAVEVDRVIAAAGTPYPSVEDATIGLERAMARAVSSEEGSAAFLELVAAGGPPQLVLAKGSPPVPQRAAGAALAQDDALASIDGDLTPTERAVAEIWARLIGGTSSDIHTDFFASGGHSLNAIRLIARVNDALHVTLPVRTLFEHPTIAGLAAAVDAARSPTQKAEADVDDRAPSTPANQQADRSDPNARSVSASQRGLWFVDQVQPQNRGYHVCGAFLIDGTIDLQALKDALIGVLQTHETLRSRFERVAGDPVVRIGPVAASVLRVHPWPGRSALQATLNAAAAQPFELDQGPLFRAALWTDGDQAHALLLSQHHIVSDEWSLECLYAELSARYAASIRGEPYVYRGATFFELRERDVPEASDATRQYWRDALADVSFAVPFPTDRPRPRIATTEGARYIASMSAASAQALRAFAREQGVTLFAAMLSAYQACLAAWCRIDDLVVATPASLRQQPGAEDALGCLVSTAVVRADLSGDPTYRQLVRRTRDVVLNALDRHRIAFDELVRLVDAPADPGRGRLFQTMFALFPVTQKVSLGAAVATPMHVDAGGAQVDLTCYVADDGEGLEAIVEYNTDLFDEATIARLVARLDAWIVHAVAAPDTPVRALAPLSDEERATLCAFEQGPRRRLARDASPRDMMLAQAKRSPDRVAVTDTLTGASLTYAQLVAEASTVAAHLRDRGVHTGDRVGICVPRDVRLPALLLGVWMAGASYVPLDPMFPPARLRAMADDARLSLCVVAPHTAALFETDVPSLLVADAFAPRPTAAHAPGAKPAKLSGESTAYVIYTSGSTGRPKGVCVPHRAVANFLRSMARVPGLQASDRLLAVTTISFDISVLELFGPLSTGGMVCVADASTASDPSALSAALTEHEITVLQATPATWRMLTLADWRSPTTRAFCGGEPLPADLARDLLGRVPSLWNLYGPTEATVWSTTEQVVDASDITIGRPIDNTTIRLLDAHGNRVPIGTPGRLFIGGDGVASGYHRRRALTAQRFIEDPFAGEESARLYDTGDWAYWRADGRLAFASRDDDQVKVRGFRIELGDVEAAIGAVAGVKAAAVAVWSPSAGDTRLVAYVVADPSSPLDQVRDALRERLPEYMVPSLWIAMDALPMTPNLKLDRRRLPPPQPVALGQSARALSSARERWLARIWMDALGTGSLGPQSNFFDCGGHSLLAMQVLHRIETETGVRINPLELSLQTLAQLAARIDEGAARTPEAS